MKERKVIREISRRVEEYASLLAQLGEDKQHVSPPPIVPIYDKDDLVEIFSKDPDAGIIYHDRYIYLVKDPVVFRRSNSRGTFLRIISTSVLHGGQAGAAVLGLIRNKGVLLHWHYRHPSKETSLEIPRGFSDPGETAEETAAREVWTETGSRIRRWESLGLLHPNGGLLADATPLFFAELELQGERQLEESEAIGEIVIVPPEELWRRIGEGEITDAFTISAAVRAKYRGLLTA